MVMVLAIVIAMTHTYTTPRLQLLVMGREATESVRPSGVTDDADVVIARSTTVVSTSGAANTTSTSGEGEGEAVGVGGGVQDGDDLTGLDADDDAAAAAVTAEDGGGGRSEEEVMAAYIQVRLGAATTTATAAATATAATAATATTATTATATTTTPTNHKPRYSASAS